MVYLVCLGKGSSAGRVDEERSVSSSLKIWSKPSCKSKVTFDFIPTEMRHFPVQPTNDGETLFLCSKTELLYLRLTSTLTSFTTETVNVCGYSSSTSKVKGKLYFSFVSILKSLCYSS